MTVEPEVVFNMDLANGPTSVRYCIMAADILDARDTLPPDLSENMEWLNEIVEEWDDKLFAAGYYVWRSCGDVVVYDLRPLTDDEREEFYKEMENM